MSNENFLSYRDRIRLLAQKKQEQTQEKIKKVGYMDEDDYGTVLPPDDFHWEPIPNHPNGSFYGAKGWSENFSSLMEKHPVYVDPLDAIAGRWMIFMSRRRKAGWNPDYDYSDLKPDQEKYGIISGIGADAHFAGDYQIGLELGWGGLLKKVRYYRQEHGPEKAEFYQAEEDVIIAIQTWIRHTVEAIKTALRNETRAELKQNLSEMLKANEFIIDNPPRTMREVCQWIAWYNMASRTYNRDGAGCQLDEILRSSYERDLREGKIDDEKAIYYIACLLLNDPHYYQVGGPGPDGRDLTSHVSFLILEAAHALGIPENLTIRVHDGLNKELYNKSIEYLFKDRKGWPRYSGDKALVEGFVKNGYSKELARRRIAVGCHWMAIPGSEYTLNDCVKINTAKVFEVSFAEMMEDRNLSPSIKELWERFEKHLRRAVLCTARGIDFHLDYQKYNEPELLLNLLMRGPVEKGVDITDNGVEYYDMCVDGTGLAVVADSFAALEQRIEKEKLIGWNDLYSHIKDNFSGIDGERIRLMMQHSQHYGQGNSLGDEWAKKVSDLLTHLVKENPTPEGRNMIPGWFSWSNTISMGKIIGATPNGRKAGQPISHGANPIPGFRKDSAATAMSTAIARIQPGYGNTAPIQLELDPGTINDKDGIKKIGNLIKTHFDMGGTLFNINVIDAKKILDANKDPSKYPDLVVRVTGFTAYFAALSPEFRQLVVDRIIAE